MLRRLLPPAGALLVLLVLAAPACAGTRTFSYKFGPLPVGPYQAVKESTVVKTPAKTGKIVRMSARVVDSKGRVIPQSEVMLHHLAFFNAGREGKRKYDNTCTHAPQRFFGTSEELRDLTLPEGYGYPSDRRDRWSTAWMLMNHTHRDRKAYIRYRVTVDDAPGLTQVRPYWVSVVPCGADPQYSVRGGRAEGSTHTRRRTWKAPLDGRIVAVGGHLHGGGRGLRLYQRKCKRTLVTSKPTYGRPDDPVYQVRPLLHEPDPLNITWWQSGTGIPVRKGEELVVASDYDEQRPHMRVMGIGHVYIAKDSKARGGCPALPADAQELGPDFTGRSEPPPVKLTLARMGDDGRAHPIDRPPGKTRRFGGGTAQIKEMAYSYRPANISIPRGGRVRWTFHDPDDHDVTLNSGPVGFGSPWSTRGDTWTRRFNQPGLYKLFCSLHPTSMSQTVRVREGG